MAGLVWQLAKDKEQATVVKLSGSIDEDAQLDRLAAELKASTTPLRLDLADVRRINSCGVREWVNFMRSLPKTVRVDLENCAPVVVVQINMISNFAGHARVVSVKAPFVCESCGFEAEALINVIPGSRPQFASRPCPKCSKPTFIFDDIEDAYFAFVTGT